MKTEHQFKPGEKALLPCKIFIAYLEGGYYVEIDDTLCGKVYAEVDQLHPFPREGGYRLTLEELILLLTDFGNTRHHGSKITPSEFAPLWLANRKEAGNE